MKVDWYVRGHVIYTAGVYTLAQFNERDALIMAMLDSVTGEHPVHLIVDYTNVSDEQTADIIAVSLKQYIATRAGKVRVSAHPRFGQVVAVRPPTKGADFSAKLLALAAQYPRNTFDDLASALAFLKAIDPQLPYDLV